MQRMLHDLSSKQEAALLEERRRRDIQLQQVREEHAAQLRGMEDRMRAVLSAPGPVRGSDPRPLPSRGVEDGRASPATSSFFFVGGGDGPPGPPPPPSSAVVEPKE